MLNNEGNIWTGEKVTEMHNGLLWGLLSKWFAIELKDIILKTKPTLYNHITTPEYTDRNKYINSLMIVGICK